MCGWRCWMSESTVKRRRGAPREASRAAAGAEVSTAQFNPLNSPLDGELRTDILHVRSFFVPSFVLTRAVFWRNWKTFIPIRTVIQSWLLSKVVAGDGVENSQKKEESGAEESSSKANSSPVREVQRRSTRRTWAQEGEEWASDSLCYSLIRSIKIIHFLFINFTLMCFVYSVQSDMNLR